jgi:FkbM family methyltransferase
MNQFLQRLRKEEFVPKKVLDIGAEKGSWTLSALQVFDSSHYTLVEPIEYTELNKFKTYHTDKFEVIHTILNDYDGQVDWYEMRNTGDSINKERTYHFNDCLPVKKECKQLDSLYEHETFDLIKIDVQGAELNVLEGGKKMIQNTSFIILEMPFMGQYNTNTPNFLTHIQKMDQLGFVPYDIVDQHRCDDTLLFQLDMCFINKTHSLNNKIQTKIDNMGK